MKKNPLIRFTPSDIEKMKRYLAPPSEQTIKKAAKRGEEPKRQALLYKLAARAESGGNVTLVRADRSKRKRTTPPQSKMLTGKTLVPRTALITLETYLQRHPDGLSKGAKDAIRRAVARRKRREWWNFVDDTAASKFAREKGDLTPDFIHDGFAVTYAPPQTCPAPCGMRGSKPGDEDCDDPSARLCYAGEHNALQQWKSLWKGYTGLTWPSFLNRLRESKSKIVRLNIAGDLPADMSDPTRKHLDRERVMELAEAAAANGRVAFTYTHFPINYRDNKKILRDAIDKGLQINLSADSLRDADRKAAAGFDVAVVIPRIRYEQKDPVTGRVRSLIVGQGSNLTTPAGRKIFFCPNITTKSVKKKTKAIRVRELQKNLGRPLNDAEKAAISIILDKGSNDPRGKKLRPLAAVEKTCATCTLKGPECAKRDRGRIIGFPLHGTAGGEKNLSAEQAEEMLLAPKLTPVARKEISDAVRRAVRSRTREAKKKRKLYVMTPAEARFMENPKRRRKRRRVVARKRTRVRAPRRVRRAPRRASATRRIAVRRTRSRRR